MDILQLSGGVILVAGYVPQIRRILATRSANDLSLAMWLSILAGVSLMEVYAVNLFLTTGARALLITNSASLIASLTMVWLIVAYGTRPGWLTILEVRRVTGRRMGAAEPAPVALVTEVQQAA